MSNLAAEQFDKPERWEISTYFGIVQLGGLREDKPYTIVLRIFGAVAQHDHDLVSRIDRETRKHGSYFWLERCQRFKNERVGSRSACLLRRLGNPASTEHSARIAREDHISHEFQNI